MFGAGDGASTVPTLVTAVTSGISNKLFSAQPHAEGCLKIRKGEVTVFFRNYSTYEGEPARLYRSPDKIRQDIFEIKTKIESVNQRLNIRNILSEVMDEYAYGEAEKWIPALSDIVFEAEETLNNLKSLRESLDALCKELEDTKWALGI